MHVHTSIAPTHTRTQAHAHTHTHIYIYIYIYTHTYGPFTVQLPASISRALSACTSHTSLCISVSPCLLHGFVHMFMVHHRCGILVGRGWSKPPDLKTRAMSRFDLDPAPLKTHQEL